MTLEIVRRRSPWRYAIGILLCGTAPLLTAAACLPSEPAVPAPVAVRLSGDDVEVVRAGCDPVDVAMVELILPGQDTIVVEESDPVLWRVEFAAGYRLETLPIGQAPETASESIPLVGALTPEEQYALRLTTPEDHRIYVTVNLGLLETGGYYDGRYLPPAEFESTTDCVR